MDGSAPVLNAEPDAKTAGAPCRNLSTSLCRVGQDAAPSAAGRLTVAAALEIFGILKRLEAAADQATPPGPVDRSGGTTPVGSLGAADADQQASAEARV
jgi:hypothetical protein